MEIASREAVGLAALLAVSAPTAQGAEWSLAPTLSVALDHDSNRTLSAEPIPSEGLSMSLDMRLQRATERLNLSLRPQVHLQRFSDRRFDRSDDGGLEAATTWLGERSSFAVSGVLRDQSTLTSEIATTGIIDINTRRRDENATAAWTFQQSERRSTQLSMTFSSARYHGSAATSLQDNRYLTLGARELFRTSERLSLSLSGSLGEYRTSGVGDKTRLTNASGGLNWQISERNLLTVDLGVNRRTDRLVATQGLVGGLTVSRSTDLGGYRFSAQRNVAPSGYGLLTQSDEVLLAANRALGPRLSIDSSVGYYRTTSAFHAYSLADRRYLQLGMGLAWHASELWSIGTRASASRATTTGFAGMPLPTTDGWQVSLNSVWTPARRSISR